jgi:energy-coupling factor transporter ATP-binding protein EcfA2
MSSQYIFTMYKLSRTHPSDKQVLKDISLSFLPGAKIGVLGLNGAGKSTLLRIMAGQDKEYRGEAQLAPGATVGLLEQEPHLDESKDVRGNVEDGVAELRELLRDVRVCVAALGPKMLRLAGRVADVVLLNWALPQRVAASRQQIVAGALEAERPVPIVAGYVRVAVGLGAEERLAAEVERYARNGGWYERAIAAQGNGLIGVACEDPDEVPAALAPYREALDTCVVRGLPAGDDLNDWLKVADAAAPRR